MQFRTIFAAAAIAFLTCSCMTTTDRFELCEDPYRFSFEKTKDRSLTTTLGSMTCISVWNVAGDEILVALGDLGKPELIEKQWLREGCSKYFKVGDREYVFTVIDVDDSPAERDRAIFEIATWETFQSWCRREDAGGTAFLFGSF